MFLVFTIDKISVLLLLIPKIFSYTWFLLPECSIQNIHGKLKEIAIISEIEKNVAQKKYYNQACTVINSLKRFLSSVPHLMNPLVNPSQKQTDHNYAVMSEGDDDIEE